MTTSIKPRRSFHVAQRGRAEHDGLLTIRLRPAEHDEQDFAFYLYDEVGDVIATCDSAKRLSDWAFEHGAQEVRHAYNLKLSDGEM